MLSVHTTTTHPILTLNTRNTTVTAIMPKCFMAKKLKYPYEQWKQEKLERTPSPEQPMELTCYKQEIIAGKWCSMLPFMIRRCPAPTVKLNNKQLKLH